MAQNVIKQGISAMALVSSIPQSALPGNAALALTSFCGALDTIARVDIDTGKPYVYEPSLRAALSQFASDAWIDQLLSHASPDELRSGDDVGFSITYPAFVDATVSDKYAAGNSLASMGLHAGSTDAEVAQAMAQHHPAAASAFSRGQEFWQTLIDWAQAPDLQVDHKSMKAARTTCFESCISAPLFGYLVMLAVYIGTLSILVYAGVIAGAILLGPAFWIAIAAVSGVAVLAVVITCLSTCHGTG
jgi:hypothetical protein